MNFSKGAAEAIQNFVTFNKPAANLQSHVGLYKGWRSPRGTAHKFFNKPKVKYEDFMTCILKPHVFVYALRTQFWIIFFGFPGSGQS